MNRSRNESKSVAGRALAAVPKNLNKVLRWNLDMVQALRTGTSRTFWVVMAIGGFYFLALTLLIFVLGSYLMLEVGFSQEWAVRMRIWVLIGGMSIAQLGTGPLVDRFGVRKVALSGLAIFFVGLVFFSPLLGPGKVVAVLALIVITVGGALLPPAFKAGVIQNTTPNASGAGFVLLLVVMQLGALVGLSLFWFFGAKEYFMTLAFVIMHASVIIVGIGAFFALVKDVVKEKRPQAMVPLGEHKAIFWRVMLLLVVMIPVRIVFRVPLAFLPDVATNLYGNESFIGNLLFWSPAVLITCAILGTAIKRQMRPYTVLQLGVGTAILAMLVMSLPTHWFGDGTTSSILRTYMILISVGVGIMAIGEFLWWPTVQKMVAAAAPPALQGTFVGVGRLPLWIADVIAGFLFGALLFKYCDEGVAEKLEGLVYAESPSRMFSLMTVIGLLTFVPMSLYLKRWINVPPHDESE